MTSKKSPAKKPVRKTTKKASSKNATEMRSFHLYQDEKPFTRFRITRQTFYWTVLLVFIIIIQLWILKVQLDIANVTTSLLAN